MRFQSSPHFIGHGGVIAGEAIKTAFAEADVILNVGCRYSSWIGDELGPLARRHHRLINISIDSSSLGAPALHEVAMVADASLALADLLAALGAAPQMACEGNWLPRMRAVRAGYDAALAEMAQEQGEVMHPAALAQAIAHALPRRLGRVCRRPHHVLEQRLHPGA